MSTFCWKLAADLMELLAAIHTLDERFVDFRYPLVALEFRLGHRLVELDLIFLLVETVFAVGPVIVSVDERYQVTICRSFSGYKVTHR
jgi:hypothetical protein